MKLAALFVCLLVVSFGCAKRAVIAPSQSEGAPNPPSRSADPPSAHSGGAASAEPQPRGPIYFAYDEARLGEDARRTLTEVGRVLLQDSAMRVGLEGHCDERGTAEYNLALGERRAVAAREFLSAYGVEPSRLATLSFGEEKPTDPGHAESSWALNRRVEIVSR